MPLPRAARFVPCAGCGGGHKEFVEEEDRVVRCGECNDNGLCEGLLKNEYTKFQETHEKFCKDKAAHIQNFKDMFSKFEDDKEKLLAQYEVQRKKEMVTLSELEKTFSEKIVNAEESLKKMKQDNKSIHILCKSIGSFLSADPDDQSGCRKHQHTTH